MNSIISWVGGKKALRDLIYQRMPKEFERYIEVFGSGGWVIFGKPPNTPMKSTTILILTWPTCSAVSVTVPWLS